MNVRMSVHVLERSGHVVSLRGVVTVPWKEANDTEDAMSKALLVASKAEAAAAAAEGEAAAVEPFMMFRWLASAETLKKAARLRGEADDARRKAEAAVKTVTALKRFRDLHSIQVARLQILANSYQRVSSLYEPLVPDSPINPRRWLFSLTSFFWSLLVNICFIGLFFALFLGMTGIFLSYLGSAHVIVSRTMDMVGVDFHVLFGLFISFWLGNSGWSFMSGPGTHTWLLGNKKII